MNEDVHVEVKSGKPIPYYVYAIVARGNIIKQEHVKLPENVKTHEIIIKPTFEMVPESHLYVYFVQDGDLQFEELTLIFPKEFQNKVSYKGETKNHMPFSLCILHKMSLNRLKSLHPNKSSPVIRLH